MKKSRILCASSRIDASTSSTLCPFLYQTRTIHHAQPPSRRHFCRQYARQIRPPLLQTSISGCAKRSMNTTTDQQLDQAKPVDQERLSFLKQKALQAQQTRDTRQEDSTITPAERRIFKRLGRKFGTDIGSIVKPLPPHHAKKANQEDQEILPEVNLDKHLVTGSTVEFERSAAPYDTDPERILSLFANSSTPGQSSAVRQAALTVLQQVSASTNCVLLNTTSALPLDLALWRYFEAEVFSLIKLLQSPMSRTTNTLDSDQPQPQSTTTSPSIHQSSNRLNLESVPLSTLPPTLLSANLNPTTPLLPLLAILYPSAALIALRTLAAHTPASPTLKAFLPRIRELGPTSYLLAGNTHLFNALLRVEWEVYQDTRSLETMLRDMRRDGVGYDDETVAIIEEIIEERRQGVKDGKEWYAMKGLVDGVRRLGGVLVGVRRDAERRRVERGERVFHTKLERWRRETVGDDEEVEEGDKDIEDGSAAVKEDDAGTYEWKPVGPV